MSKIKVYSGSRCPYCVMLKDWLKENKIEFEEVDVSQNRKAAQEIIEKTGQMGIPVTEINGEFIIGFDKEKLKKALKLWSFLGF